MTCATGDRHIRTFNLSDESAVDRVGHRIHAARDFFHGFRVGGEARSRGSPIDNNLRFILVARVALDAQLTSPSLHYVVNLLPSHVLVQHLQIRRGGIGAPFAFNGRFSFASRRLSDSASGECHDDCKNKDVPMSLLTHVGGYQLSAAFCCFDQRNATIW